MKSQILLLCSFLPFFTTAQVLNCEFTEAYGNNAAHGHFSSVNGIDMYYETYGESSKQPLLLIHGNGGSVKSATCQIEYFKDDYYVVIADSRVHGKSGVGTEELTYRLMASDYNALLNHLDLDSVYIIGQSDGGIIGLLMAIEFPQKVKKVVSTAPNLRPDSTALFQWNIDDLNSDLKEINEKIEKGDTSLVLKKRKILMELMKNHPHISTEELKKIKAPVLLIFGDSDYMPLDHAQEIYEHIPNAQLFVIPGAGHRTYRLEPELFNMFCTRFFDRPFTKPSARDGF